MIRLLGDMRSYNYVIVPTHDFDQVVYKIRAIDFDQQSYEAKLKVYRPQFFKENFPMANWYVLIWTSTQSINIKSKNERLSPSAYQLESRLTQLMKCMLKMNSHHLRMSSS